MSGVLTERGMAIDRTAELDEALHRCNKCGFCQASCPMYLTTREEWAAARGRLRLLKGVQQGELGRGAGYVRALYQCFSCGACAATCPSGVLVEEILLDERRRAVRDGLLPEPLGRLAETVSTSGSLTGEGGNVRLSWTHNMDTPPRQSRRPGTAYFVGCVSSLFPRAYGLPQSMVGLLERSGEDYAILGGEVCCGYPLYVSGLEAEARALALANLESIQETGARRLLTTCPSCYRAWREFYPELLGADHGLEVLHATQWLGEAGVILKPLQKVVTYQDPCDLGRASGIYEAPRRFLSRIEGLVLVEMQSTRAEALCCGGGGNMESLDPPASRSVLDLRMQQALGTGAEVVVTACPQCRRTFSSSRSGHSGLRVWDIVEIALRQARP